MNVQEILLSAMEDNLGLAKDEMTENLDLDLFENDLADSLGIVTLINEMESALGKKLDITQMRPEDFRTVNKLCAAIEAQL